MTVTTLPAPLTPADCDLKDQRCMLLDVHLLCDSALASHDDAEVFRSAMLLFCKSWHETPAASLPNDDRKLAALAGFGRHGLEHWMKIKDEVMAGFVLCQDEKSEGRYYHPVVAEKALERWIGKLMRRLSGARGNDTQGKAGGAAIGMIEAALFDAAERLTVLNPRSDALEGKAIAEVLKRLSEGDVEPQDPPGPTAKAMPSRRGASRDATRTADAKTTGRERSASRTADAMATQEKGREYISPPTPPSVGLDDACRKTFDEAVAIFPAAGKARTRIDQAWPAWSAAASEAGGEAALLGCVRALAASTTGGGVPGLQNWLSRGLWRVWLKTKPAPVGRPWAGPPELWAAIRDHAKALRLSRCVDGDDYCRSFLSPTEWRDLPSKAIVCRSALIAQRLRDECGAVIAEHGAVVVLEQDRVAA